MNIISHLPRYSRLRLLWLILRDGPDAVERIVRRALELAETPPPWDSEDDERASTTPRCPDCGEQNGKHDPWCFARMKHRPE